MKENQILKDEVIDEKEENRELVSYSYVDENGVFRETYGYSEKNTVDAVNEFFDNLSQEDLDSIRRR